MTSLMYDIIEAQRCRICQIDKRIQKKIIWFFKMSYFFLFWVVFWCIQGAEVELGLRNSTSAPCTYQKNVSGAFRMRYWYSIFQKSKKKVTEKKFKISLKIEFLLKMKFLVISGHFRLDFLHQKIVSSL